MLTPQFLVEHMTPAERGNWSGIGLVVVNGQLVVRAKDRHGYTVDGPPQPTPALLVVDEVAEPEQAKPISVAAWWACLWWAERAVKRAQHQDWEGVGEAVDQAYGAEREHLLGPSAKADLAYAAARSAGAWGGRPSGNALLLLAPPEHHERIRTEVRKVL
jgi:hypothetical protein